MMDHLKSWIVGIIAVTFALSLAEDLIRQPAIRRIWKLAGGVVLILAVLSPLRSLVPGDWTVSLEDYRREVTAVEQVLRQEQDIAYAAGIEQEIEAYIWDKAAAFGLAGEIRVKVSPQTGIPEEIWLEMPFDPRLSEFITQQLGLDREQQEWQED